MELSMSSNILQSLRDIIIKHNMIQGCGPLEYNSRMLGAQLKFESPCRAFPVSNYIIPKTH
jgi:hypothetical protein